MNAYKHTHNVAAIISSIVDSISLDFLHCFCTMWWKVCSQTLKNFVQYFHEHSFHHMVHKQCKKPRDILSTIEEIIAATLWVCL